MRLARIVGLGCYVGTLFRYRSPSRPEVFGIWSYPFFAVLIASVVVLAICLLRLGWRLHGRPPGRERAPAASRCFDLAILAWGSAYALAAIDDPIAAGRIADLNLVGSLAAPSSILEWLALVLFAGGLGLKLAPRLGGRRENAALAVGSVAVALLLGEGLERVRVIVAPTVQGFPTYSSQAWQRRYVKLNHEGFREVERERTTGAGTHRLLVVGDSCAYGWGIRRMEDRFGEQLALFLTQRSDQRWTSLNASRGDTHTLDHIGFVQQMLRYEPDVVVLLYTFNDIDYLRPVTPRETLGRLHPRRILVANSYLLQGIWVRVRAILRRSDTTSIEAYRDDALLTRHLEAVAQFVSEAGREGAVVGVVPLDVGVVADSRLEERYAHFLREADEKSIPLWSLEGVFAAFTLDQLTINALDRHPSELAFRVAAKHVAEQIPKTTLRTLEGSNGLTPP